MVKRTANGTFRSLSAQLGKEFNRSRIQRVMSTSRTGRRPGESHTRDAILAAARTAFAARGLSGATIRGIAADAGVDPALVAHYFGSKRGLFVEAVQFPVDPGALADRLRDGAPEEAAIRAANFFFETWEHPAFRAVLLSLLRAGLEDERAAAMLRDRLSANLVGPAIASLGADQPELRGALVASQVLGLAAVRYILRFQPLASLPPDEIAALVAPTIQRYLTGPLEAIHD